MSSYNVGAGGYAALCTACGACCRRAGWLLKDWPVKPGTVECIYLQPDNRCAIYATRPDVCRIGALTPAATAVYAALCNTMQAEDHMAASFTVVVPPGVG